MLIPRFAEICAYAMPGTAVLLVCLTKVGARMMWQYISFDIGGAYFQDTGQTALYT